MPSLSCLCTRLCAPHNEFDSSPVLLLPIGASETSRTLWTTRNTYAGTLNRTKRKVYSFLRSVDLISICMFRLLVLCSSIAVVYFSPIKFYCNFLFDWSVFCVFKCFRISIVFFFSAWNASKFQFCIWFCSLCTFCHWQKVYVTEWKLPQKLKLAYRFKWVNRSNQFQNKSCNFHVFRLIAVSAQPINEWQYYT